VRKLYIKTCKSEILKAGDIRREDTKYWIMDTYKSEDTGGRILVRGHWREDTKH
jgi:hypothetical protein